MIPNDSMLPKIAQDGRDLADQLNKAFWRIKDPAFHKYMQYANGFPYEVLRERPDSIRRVTSTLLREDPDLELAKLNYWV